MTRALIAIPAHNEEATIAAVVASVRQHLPGLDLLVVNDGSRDRTAEVLAGLGVTTARHDTNLGYGRAIQTAIKYAARCGYDVLVTLDADGQHDPSQVPALLAAAQAGRLDLCSGSRYVSTRSYAGVPTDRKLGMLAFSHVVKLLTGTRVYDTTSGMKAFGPRVYGPLSRWHFVDFHAEALVYLLRLGFTVGEHPITVEERRHGQSMYSLLSWFKYPAKTMLMALAALWEAELTRKELGR
jgi:glycosyltransferase involved in cell wall biosynthesis